MLNFALMSRWENWVYIFLMITIFLMGLHIFTGYLPKVEDE